jgi:inosine/xanthosine triphosphatase
LLVLIGSTRPAKIEGVRDALAAIGAIEPGFAGAALRPIDVSDIAPCMPMSEADIIAGARARAAHVLERSRGELIGTDVYYAVGVEGGIDCVAPNLYAVKTWACVTDGRGISFGGGGAIVLPDEVAAEVLAGRELGDVIDGRAGVAVRGTRGAWGLLTRDLVTRREAFRTAVLSAFAPFYNARFYGPTV